MQKILVTATVPQHIYAFHLPLLRRLAEDGWEVHVATHGVVNDPAVKKSHELAWTRSPASFGNVRALRQLRKIIDLEAFDVIYCHTPVGAAVTRLAAARARKQGTRVVYMAHGFHFYSGAPVVNWIVYFPAEWLLSHLTDELLVINREDFDRARRCFPTRIRLTKGVGIDVNSFHSELSPARRAALRRKIGVSDESTMVLAVAEVNKNKNHELLVRSWKRLVDQGYRADLVVAGEGPLRTQLETLAEDLGVSHCVHFLGFRNDVQELLAACDLVVAPSVREGLPSNVIEAMASGKPALVSRIRGHIDLIDHGKTGYLISGENAEEWASAIGFMLNHPERCSVIGADAREFARSFSTAGALQAILPALRGCDSR